MGINRRLTPPYRPHSGTGSTFPNHSTHPERKSRRLRARYLRLVAGRAAEVDLAASPRLEARARCRHSDPGVAPFPLSPRPITLAATILEEGLPRNPIASSHLSHPEVMRL